MTNAVAIAQQGSNNTTFRNRIINGAMTIDQRNAGASYTVPAGGGYSLDRWFGEASQASKYTIQQSSTAPAGFVNSLKLTSSSAYSLTAGDYFQVQQSVEGFNTADFNFGTANAKTITLSFWVNASITGTYGMFLINNASSRIYPTSYTVNAANTWEQKTIVVAGDTTGTWETTTSRGIRIAWTLGYGSTYTGATPNAWTGGSLYIPSGCVNFVGTSGATLYITGVQLETGSAASPFEQRSYGTEFALCQRYYYKQYNGQSYIRFGNGFTSSSTVAFETIAHPVIMRVAPTSVTTTGNLCIWQGGGAIFGISAIAIEAISTSTTSTCLQCTVSGATSQSAYQLMSNNDGTATVALSAEL